MTKKKICWVTPDWFIDVDMPIVPHLLDQYDITWIITFPWRHNRFKDEDFKPYFGNPSLEIKFIHFKYYGLDPRNLEYYSVIKSIIRAVNPDLIYLNIEPGGPLILPFYRWLPTEKTIVTAHDGYVKSSFRHPWLAKKCFDLGYNTRSYIQLFSNGEEAAFHKLRPSKKTFVIPLALKDFGKPTEKLREDFVTFASFGNIYEDKNIVLAIKAGEKLYDKGYRNFRIVIKGRCAEWEKDYVPFIKHPELIEADLRFIDNSEIANIYARNWYGLFPYKQSAQSGAIKVALNYDKPVIVSNLPGFLEDIKDGFNGYIFKNNDVDDLARVMEICINNSREKYNDLVRNVTQFVNAKYSSEKIISQYVEMIEYVIGASER